MRIDGGMVWKSYLACMLLCQVLLIGAAMSQMSAGRDTVSVWLRAHRIWWDYALAIAAGIVSVITTHLFWGGVGPR